MCIRNNRIPIFMLLQPLEDPFLYRKPPRKNWAALWSQEISFKSLDKKKPTIIIAKIGQQLFIYLPATIEPSVAQTPTEGWLYISKGRRSVFSDRTRFWLRYFRCGFTRRGLRPFLLLSRRRIYCGSRCKILWWLRSVQASKMWSYAPIKKTNSC